MQFERVDDREALLSERGRLEGALQSSEEWRALLQVKARLVRGGDRPSVHTKRLETSLLRTLESNADFQRYRAVVIAISHLPDLLPDPLPDLRPDVRSFSGVEPTPEKPAVLEDRQLPVEPLVFIPTPLVPPARRGPPPLPQAHSEASPAVSSPRAMFAKLGEPGHPFTVRAGSENARCEIDRQGFMPIANVPPPLSGSAKGRFADGRGSTPAGRFLKALTGH